MHKLKSILMLMAAADANAYTPANTAPDSIANVNANANAKADCCSCCLHCSGQSSVWAPPSFPAKLLLPRGRSQSSGWVTNLKVEGGEPVLPHCQRRAGRGKINSPRQAEADSNSSRLFNSPLKMLPLLWQNIHAVNANIHCSTEVAFQARFFPSWFFLASTYLSSRFFFNLLVFVVYFFFCWRILRSKSPVAQES